MPYQFHRLKLWGICTTRHDRISQLNIFDPDTLEFKGVKNIEGELHKVQGGEIYDGMLYLTINRDGQTVFAVNLKTGESQIAFKRNLNAGSEGEGLTILPMSDGSFIHTLDIAESRVGVRLRHYAFDHTTLEWKEQANISIRKRLNRDFIIEATVSLLIYSLYIMISVPFLTEILLSMPVNSLLTPRAKVFLSSTSLSGYFSPSSVTPVEISE